MTQGRAIGRLLLTGVPGWFSEALLQDFHLGSDGRPSVVRCLVQPSTQFDEAAFRARHSLNLEFVYGDLLDPKASSAAVHDVDTIVHAAGLLHARRTHDWYAVNTGGTKALAEAAAAAGVKRFVFLSSNAASGRAQSFDRLLSESDPPRPLSHYGRSKLLAEEAILALAAQIEPVILRPCMFYGPPVPMRHVEIYERIRKGRMPLVGGGNYARSLTHIENLVHGARLAMIHPRAVGETFFIADKPVYTTQQIVEAMASALETIPRYYRLPSVVATLAYQFDMGLAALELYWQTLHLVGESNWHVGVSCDKAVRELGYAPKVTLYDGMRRAVRWCIEQGLFR